MRPEAVAPMIVGLVALVGLFRYGEKRRVPQGHLGFKLRRGHPVRHRIKFWKWGEIKVYQPGLRVLCLPILHELVKQDVRDQVYVTGDPIMVLLKDQSTINIRAMLHWKVLPQHAAKAKLEIEDLSQYVAAAFVSSVQRVISNTSVEEFNFDKVEGSILSRVNSLISRYGASAMGAGILERNPTAATRWALSRPMWIEKSAEGLVKASKILGHDTVEEISRRDLIALTEGSSFAALAEIEAGITGESGQSDTQEEAIIQPLRIVGPRQ